MSSEEQDPQSPQTPPPAARMREISERLEAIRSELDSEQVADDAASELTREAAALAAEAVEEASRLLQEAAD